MLSLTSIRVSADTRDRPAIAFNRWSEDWSVIADPDVPREPLDELKYIPLSDDDAWTYLSLGANIRERFEVNDANFGTGGNQQDSYLLSRTEAHADEHGVIIKLVSTDVGLKFTLSADGVHITLKG